MSDLNWQQSGCQTQAHTLVELEDKIEAACAYACAQLHDQPLDKVRFVVAKIEGHRVTFVLADEARQVIGEPIAWIEFTQVPDEGNFVLAVRECCKEGMMNSADFMRYSLIGAWMLEEEIALL